MLSTTSPILINATVTISRTEFEVNSTLVRGDYVDVVLPTSVYLRGTGLQNDKTIVVRASAKVSVHVMGNEGRSTDGFHVLPTSQLGNDHYVLTYTPFGKTPSYICVSAFKSKTTTVKIRTESGRTYSIVLQQYDSYQLAMSGEDLSGSRVTSNYPVTVVAGNRVSDFIFGRGSGDSLLELIPPVTIWGTHVILSPFMGKDNGYLYRVVGTNVPTEVVISNVGTVTLTERQWFEGNITNDTMVTVTSDHPILVMQYIKEYGSNKHRTADPSMILAPSTNLYTSKSIVFPVFDVIKTTLNYFIHIVTECNKVTGLTYENISIANWEILASANGEMCSVRGNVTEGAVHTVGHEDGTAKFTVAVYGLAVFGSNAFTSYAYLAGIEDFGKNIICLADSAISRANHNTLNSLKIKGHHQGRIRNILWYKHPNRAKLTAIGMYRCDFPVHLNDGLKFPPKDDTSFVIQISYSKSPNQGSRTR